MSPPDFLARALSARRSLCPIHKTVKSVFLLQRGRWTATSRYRQGHKGVSELCLDTKPTEHNALSSYSRGFYLVSSLRTWLINQAAQVERSVCVFESDIQKESEGKGEP